MKITPQDIIDREFKVKFRGFDMAEVDAFLEEIAENFFKLTEENTLLNEKILALRQDLEAGGSLIPRGQLELPDELGSILEDLKQDTAAIGADLVALKQDRQPLDSFDKNLKAAVAAIKEAASLLTTHQGAAENSRDLAKVLEDYRHGTEKMGAELAALREEVAAIAKFRAEIKEEFQELLTTRFAEMDGKLSALADKTVHTVPKPKAASPAPEKLKGPVAAQIKEEPGKPEDDTRLPDYLKDDETSDHRDLEFLSEDDILDVDKLRGIFQSVLDEDIGEGEGSHEEEEETAELLFLDGDFIADEHEPAVTFSLDEKETPQKTKFRKP